MEKIIDSNDSMNFGIKNVINKKLEAETNL